MVINISDQVEKFHLKASSVVKRSNTAFERTIRHLTHSRLFKTSILLIVFNIIAYPGFSQGNSNEKLDVSGSISVMNEEISTVPSLALGEPAATFNLSVGKRFRFEPELRFSLEGKPWSFLFWFRYDIVNRNKFSFRIGAHPAYSFRTVPALIDEADQSEEIIEARRFLAGDMNTSYSVTKILMLGSIIWANTVLNHPCRTKRTI